MTLFFFFLIQTRWRLNLLFPILRFCIGPYASDCRKILFSPSGLLWRAPLGYCFFLFFCYEWWWWRWRRQMPSIPRRPHRVLRTFIAKALPLLAAILVFKISTVMPNERVNKPYVASYTLEMWWIAKGRVVHAYGLYPLIYVTNPLSKDTKIYEICRKSVLWNVYFTALVRFM